MSGPTRVLRYTEILDLPDRFLRGHFKALLVVALPGLLVASLAPLINNWVFALGPMMGPTDPSMLIPIYAGFAVSSFVALITWLAVVRAVTVLMDDGSIGAGEAYLFALHPLRLGSLMLAAVVTFVGCCACIVPGVFGGLFLTMLLPVMAHEWVGPAHSFSRSASLIGYVPPSQGLIGSTAIQILGLWVLYYVFSAALSSFQFVPTMLASVMESWRVMSNEGLPDGPSMTFLLVISGGTLIGVFFSAVLMIYMSTCFVLLYRNVRFCQEAIDLHRALDERLATLAPLPPAEE